MGHMGDEIRRLEQTQENMRTVSTYALHLPVLCPISLRKQMYTPEHATTRILSDDCSSYHNQDATVTKRLLVT